MTNREKLIEIIQCAVNGCDAYWAGLIADALISHGVVLQQNNDNPPCWTCNHGWASITTGECKMCSDSCEELAAWNRRADNG